MRQVSCAALIAGLASCATTSVVAIDFVDSVIANKMGHREYCARFPLVYGGVIDAASATAIVVFADRTHPAAIASYAVLGLDVAIAGYLTYTYCQRGRSQSSWR